MILLLSFSLACSRAEARLSQAFDGATFSFKESGAAGIWQMKSVTGEDHLNGTRSIPLLATPFVVERTLEILVSGLVQPAAIDINSRGDVYFTEDKGRAVLRILADTRNLETVISDAEYGFIGAAFDSNDNFYYTSYWTGKIFRLSTGSDDSELFIELPGQGLRGIDAVASGDLYVASFGSNAILKISSNKTITEVVAMHGFDLVESVAVDSVGNVYFDYYGDIYRVSAGATSNVYVDCVYTCKSLYVDEKDILYYLEASANATSISRILPGLSTPQYLLSLPYDRPYRLAVRNDVMYITFYEDDYIGKVVLSTPTPWYEAYVVPAAIVAASCIVLIAAVLRSRKKLREEDVLRWAREVKKKLGEKKQLSRITCMPSSLISTFKAGL